MRTNPMIVGAPTIIYSKKPEADRLFIRDVLGFPNVDAGEGWPDQRRAHQRHGDARGGA